MDEEFTTSATGEEFTENSGVTSEENEDKSESETSKKSGLKTSFTVRATARANQIVKSRYKFNTINIDDKEFYILEASSMSFDRILRRSPREIYKYSDNYNIPLGRTSVETVISAYGLSNSKIYSSEEWFSLLSNFNNNANIENTTKVVSFLTSSAYLKYMRVKGELISSMNIYDFIYAVKKVNRFDIVNYFAEMVS